MILGAADDIRKAPNEVFSYFVNSLNSLTRSSFFEINPGYLLKLIQTAGREILHDLEEILGHKTLTATNKKRCGVRGLSLLNKLAYFF